MAQEQAKINTEIARNRIRLEEKQLERTVTEQYLLCLLDQTQMAFADSINKVLEHQEKIVCRLVESGFAKQSDLQLLAIEQASNEELRLSARQSYHTHLMDLNLLCGIEDTADVVLVNINIGFHLPLVTDGSLFMEQYRLDSLNAVAALRSFCLQYKPRLDLFVNGGLQAGDYAGWYKHFGMSAGLPSGGRFSTAGRSGGKNGRQGGSSKVYMPTRKMPNANAKCGSGNACQNWASTTGGRMPCGGSSADMMKSCPLTPKR